MSWGKQKQRFGIAKVIYVVNDIPYKSKADAQAATGQEGEKFHSIDEWKRWRVLCWQQDEGLISNLHRQVEFKLYGMGGTLISTWKVDYTYNTGECNVAEERKGFANERFELLVKLFKDNYPGWNLHITGAYQKIKDRANAKARAKYAEKKMLAMMEGE